MRRRWPRVLAGSAAALALAAAGGGVWLDARLDGSLPQLEGERPLAGLGAPVRVERDALGVPVVRGETRADVARATGFLHAQERFFQMDLQRRRAAGELAELVGRAALKLDREVRVLRLREVARRATAALPAGQQALLQAYTEGVAAGLAALAAPPFEYLVLRAEPRAWQPEDSLLCALAMYLTLQGSQPEQESRLGLMRDTLAPELFEFLGPRGSEWEAPLEGAPFAQPAIPGPQVVDVRGQPVEPRRRPSPSPGAAPTADPFAARSTVDDDDGVRLGSNNWAVAGAHTAGGGALVANDMHLGLSVPNTWYRASLVYRHEGEERRITGVTLPGAPFVVAGSTGRVAWGFTNSEGDWADLVVLDPVPGDPDAYLTPRGPRRLEHATETIRVEGAPDEKLNIVSTIWGPVVDTDHVGRRRALAWVALREGGVNAELLGLEDAAGLDDALALAPRVGIPNQNFVVADAAGRVGWTIGGRVPRRFGHDGRLPASWADGSRGWDGWVPPEQHPRIADPPGGRIWTANARVVDGERLALVGFSGYDLGARQKQIRDDLVALERATEADMLRIQLDDRALFLERWQKRLVALLGDDALAGNERRREARRLVEGWGGRAAIDSPGYRIVRAFRLRAAELAFAPLVAACRRADPGFEYPSRPFHWEGPLWALLTQKPAHLLSSGFASWEALQLAAVDRVLDELAKQGALAERTWGERNRSLIRHPLSAAVPLVARYLDMPREALPGDSHMPRFQAPSAGASERFAVSPGHEERGYFHMPTGQSGHPRSPYYAAGHSAWSRGEPAPFLPGPAVHVLTLAPAP
jgi:penicillin amidase